MQSKSPVYTLPEVATILKLSGSKGNCRPLSKSWLGFALNSPINHLSSPITTSTWSTSGPAMPGSMSALLPC